MLMCCVWGQSVKSVGFHLRVIPRLHLVAGFSLVGFRRTETHGSVTPSHPFPFPRDSSILFTHSWCYWASRGRHHQRGGTAPKSGQVLVISRGCVGCVGPPGWVPATFLSLIAAGVCPPCNSRTAVLAPLVDLGGELKPSPVPTGWGDLALTQQRRAELVLLSSVDRCLSGHRMGHWRRGTSKRPGKYV